MADTHDPNDRWAAERRLAVLVIRLEDDTGLDSLDTVLELVPEPVEELTISIH